jgi:hypothetical protein
VKQVKIDIRCDKGVFVGVLSLYNWDSIQPRVMHSGDFETLRGRLGGFSEVCKTAKFEELGLHLLKEQGDKELELLRRVNCTLNMYLVQGVGLGELMFAGAIHKNMSENRTLLTILTR